MTPDYVAPVHKVFTVVHIRDRSAPARVEAPGQSASTGKTVCGLDMLDADFWQLLDLEPTDTVCPRCLSPGSASPEQGALL
jgi:hypothetical protein